MPIPHGYSNPNDQTLIIQPGTKVRLKIVGTRIDSTEIFAIGKYLMPFALLA